MGQIPVLPPIGQAPFVNPQILTPTPSSLALLQQIWNAAFGLGGITPGILLLGYLDNINFNASGDNEITLALPSGSIGWCPQFGMVFGTQGSFSAAHASLYQLPFTQGHQLVAPTALSGITATGFNAPGAVTAMTPGAITIWNYTTLYLNVGTVQGGLSVGNFYLYGYPVF